MCSGSIYGCKVKMKGMVGLGSVGCTRELMLRMDGFEDDEGLVLKGLCFCSLTSGNLLCCRLWQEGELSGP